MPECPDQSSNITGCEPPFPPVPSPTITPAPINMCRCSSVVNGLTGINNGSFANVTGGNGFLVEVFIRKDTSASGTSLEDSFYLKWPGQITGNHYAQNDTEFCGFRPTITVKRGQWIVFRQQDDSNAGFRLSIATTLAGTSVDAIYPVTGEEGILQYRNGTTVVSQNAPSGETYKDLLASLPDYADQSTCDDSIRPCPNLIFKVPACAPDVLYYRHYTESGTEIEGGLIRVVGALAGYECETDDPCVPHTRPWEIPLVPMSLGDTFYEWYTTTNNLIAAVDPLRIYDIKILGGLKELVATENGVIYLEADVGKGLRIFPPTSPDNGFPQECAEGKIVLDIFGLPEVQVTGSVGSFENSRTLNHIHDTDLFVFERFVETEASRRGIDPNNTEANIYKVKAEHMLPYTIAGEHRFTGKVLFENPAMEINATKITIDDKAIELGASPFMELSITLVSGTAANLITGMSHDPDGDSYYYENGTEADDTSPGNTYSGITGELVVQEQTVANTYARDTTPDPVEGYVDDPYDPSEDPRGPGYNANDVDGGGQLINPDDGSTQEIPELLTKEYARATILSISNVTGGTATLKVRAFNDVPFVNGSAYTTRSGITFTITAIAGQSGNDADINGGGIILNSTGGNKTILWGNVNDAWTLNQNLAIDTNYHIVTPFNISNGTSNFANNNLGGHDYWRVNQVLEADTITGTHCLTDVDDGLLHYSYVPMGITGAAVENGQLPAFSILPCGGIYIHNIACSPQFSNVGGTEPNSIPITNEYGVLDHTHQDRIFVLLTGGQTTASFAVGQVIGLGSTGLVFLAQADTPTNAEVLGVIVALVTGADGECELGGSASNPIGLLVATGNLIDWTANMCGLTSITTGSAYFLNPITGGTLIDCEPLEVGEVRKPVALAVNTTQLLITNYEGVVNGDYFQENPVTALDELRDVDAPITGANAVVGGEYLKYNGTTDMWENSSLIVPVTAVPTTATSTGTAGQIRYSTTYIYICIDTDTWRRSPISAW